MNTVADWGTDYEAPVGEDTPSQLAMFEYTSLVIMAAVDGTTVDDPTYVFVLAQKDYPICTGP